MAKLQLNPTEINTAASALRCSADDFKVTAPVRLYKASSGSWEYTGVCGVAAVVMNPSINAVYIQVVDLNTKTVALNQEVYKEFEYKVLTPYMHAFEGDDAVFGLNFAETFDATAFGTTAKGLISLCNASVPQSKPVSSISTHNRTTSSNSSSSSSHSSSSTQGGGLGSKVKGLFGFGAKKEAPRERPKISAAKNFKHVAHLGFNSKDGFGQIPPEWKAIFDKAGVTEAELKDAKTAKFILQTIANAGAAPPSSSSSSSTSTTTTTMNSGAPPPPGPPPPPVQSRGGPPPPPSLKPMPEIAPPTDVVTTGRGDMLAQIQKGNFQLKKVSAEDIPEVDKMSEQEQNSLAYKIQQAMQVRRQAVVDDDQDDDDEEWEI